MGEKKDMKVGYLIYRENIFSPIIETQVLNILSNVSSAGIEIHIIWLKRIDYCLKNTVDIEAVKKRLALDGIILHEIPIVVGHFPLGNAMTRLVYLQTNKRIRKIVNDNNITILHTRGYDAGLLVTMIKKAHIRNTKHVFDPRSPFLSELISTYKLDPKNMKYLYWEQKEKEIVNTADLTIATSERFSSYLYDKGAKVKIIPNNIKMDPTEEIISRANSQKRNAFCFVGSLGLGWNNINTYISFFEEVYHIDPGVSFELYVINTENVKKYMLESTIPETNYTIKKLPPDLIGKAISGCLAGLQIMAMPDSRLGIKTVEYLAAGLPVITNNNAQGARDLIKKTNLGWNLDELLLSDIIHQAKERCIDIDKCVNYAFDNFSTDMVSQVYSDVYYDISPK